MDTRGPSLQQIRESIVQRALLSFAYLLLFLFWVIKNTKILKSSCLIVWALRYFFLLISRDYILCFKTIYNLKSMLKKSRLLTACYLLLYFGGAWLGWCLEILALCLNSWSMIHFQKLPRYHNSVCDEKWWNVVVWLQFPNRDEQKPASGDTTLTWLEVSEEDDLTVHL